MGGDRETERYTHKERDRQWKEREVGRDWERETKREKLGGARRQKQRWDGEGSRQIRLKGDRQIDGWGRAQRREVHRDRQLPIPCRVPQSATMVGTT